MRSDDLIGRAQRELTVCNACRYCEQYCPVFPALEGRTTLDRGELAYLANLCHNCGECLYACQYAPPHEFGINLPRTLAGLRAASYEQYCWPGPLGAAFRRGRLSTALLALAGLTIVLLSAVAAANPGSLWPSDGSADFYGVVPHGVMVAMFGLVTLFVVAAMGVSGARFWRDVSDGRSPRSGGFRRAIGDAMTLRQLHGSGVDCTSSLETRRPWRRWFHHLTFYGFALCAASTSVAAVYHASGREAPYGYTSLPVLLGVAGGIGLVAGPLGLALLRRRRDPLLSDPDRTQMDEPFLALLLITSLTGLALLAFRHLPVMAILLIVHLGSVLALLVALPYSKFVHGLYRVAALARYHSRSG